MDTTSIGARSMSSIKSQLGGGETISVSHNVFLVALPYWVDGTTKWPVASQSVPSGLDSLGEHPLLITKTARDRRAYIGAQKDL